MTTGNTPEVRSIEDIEADIAKWTQCKREMVGSLYPRVVELDYLVPLRRELAEAKYGRTTSSIGGDDGS